MSSAHLLDEIVQLSQAMLELAKNGDWDELTKQEVVRQHQIESCFPLDESIEQPQEAGEQIRTILAFDMEIMGLVRKQQQGLAEALGKIGKGRAATNAYRKNT